jgi:hypothetical protein
MENAIGYAAFSRPEVKASHLYKFKDIVAKGVEERIALQPGCTDMTVGRSATGSGITKKMKRVLDSMTMSKTFGFSYIRNSCAP